MNQNLLLIDSGEYRIIETVSIYKTTCYDYAFEVLNLLNKERTRRGLNELKMDEEQMEAAMQRAAESSICFFSSHVRPNGADCFSISDGSRGENCTAFPLNPEEAFLAWMNSPGHRDNMLGEEWTSVGIGCVYVNNNYYWVQRFGSKELDSDCEHKKDSDGTANIQLLIDNNELMQSGLNFGLEISIDSEYPFGLKTPCYTYVKEISNENGSAGAIIVPSSLRLLSENPNIVSISVDGMILAKNEGLTRINIATLNDFLTISHNLKIVREPGWHLINNDYYFIDENGVMYTGWKQMIDNGKYYWFYFGNDGISREDWEVIDGKTYYFDGYGRMRTGWTQILDKWYYFGTDGETRTGWTQVGKIWYYLGTDGTMQTGWVKVRGKWYYFDPSGAMKTNWIQSGKTWYYLGSDGAMKTGWVKVSGDWYYMNSSGAMQTGWVKIGNSWYYFKASGVMTSGWVKLVGSWYYLDASGAMVTGSRTIGGKTYQFNASGVCLNP